MIRFQKVRRSLGRFPAHVLVILLAAGCSLGDTLLSPPPTATPLAPPSATATVGPTATEPPPTPFPLTTPTATPGAAVPQALAQLDEGRQAMFNGDWERAIAAFQNAFDNAEDDNTAADALLSMGEARFRSGDLEGASGTLLTFLEMYPNAVRASDAHFWLAEAYRASGTWGLAVDEYRQYLALRPGVIDSVVQERIAGALIQNGDRAGAIDAVNAALAAPRATGLMSLRLTLGSLYSADGRFDAALAQYDAAQAEATEGWQKAQLDLLAGKALLELGAHDAANLRFTEIVNLYPEAEGALEALELLTNDNVAVTDYQRGLIYLNAGRYAGALEAFAADLAANPDHAPALYFTALCQRALGDAPTAAATLEDLIARFPEDEIWDEAWFELAWTQREFLGSFEAAIDVYQRFAEAAPADPRAPEALFLAARLAERLDNLALAAQLWGQVATTYPEYTDSTEAAFQEGIVLYRANDLETAAQTFAGIPSRPGATSEQRAAALLWLGKTRDRLGDGAGRDDAWSQAIAADPTGYYSIRAAELAAGNTGLFTPPAGYDFSFNEQAERAEAEAWLAAQVNVPNDGHLGELAPALLADGRWARGLELWRLGQINEARAEFESLRKTNETNPVAQYQLGLAFQQIGLYRLSASALNACLDQLLSDRLAAPRYFTHLRFGAHYIDLIVPIAGYYGLDPLFLLSVIRQESAFEPFAGSSAGAQGLMQVIPSTGAEIAARLGWPNYQDGDLQRPIVSLNFGAFYLSEKLTEFDRDRFAALAAYNSGSGNASAWQEIAPGDPDLFLEVIRIKETETYLKFIYEIYEIYKEQYGK